VTPGSAVHLDAGGRARCGQPRPFRLAASQEQVTCARCLAGLAPVSGTRWQWPDVKPCGTLAACRRHYRRGEKPCESCRQAEQRRWQDRRAA